MSPAGMTDAASVRRIQPPVLIGCKNNGKTEESVLYCQKNKYMACKTNKYIACQMNETIACQMSAALSGERKAERG